MFIDPMAAELTLMHRNRINGDEFDCGNCQRAQTCGLPPSYECEERLLQAALAGHGWRSAGSRGVPGDVRC